MSIKPWCVSGLLGTLILVSDLNAAAPGSAPQVVRLSEPVLVTESHEVFGTPLPADIAPVSLPAAIAGLDENPDRSWVISTEVAEVCQKKGCFFIARDGDTVARVTFENYSFFIPTDAAAKKVTLVGTLSRSELSAERAAHYAQDLGKSTNGAAAGVEYAIVATGVSVPR
ncbi:MAG: DUF4920 domain-containing protein [Pseudomonadota bacterium]